MLSGSFRFNRFHAVRNGVEPGGERMSGMDAAEPEDAWASDRVLDARGLACPLPVLKARKLIAGMAAGERLLVEATDPMAAIDLPHLCQEDGHTLIRQQRSEPGHPVILRFLIERGPGVAAG
jgi:tRNA 2-thiouridine synthesizing protein A